MNREYLKHESWSIIKISGAFFYSQVIILKLIWTKICFKLFNCRSFCCKRQQIRNTCTYLHRAHVLQTLCQWKKY